jgi:hypothetical protein
MNCATRTESQNPNQLSTRGILLRTRVAQKPNAERKIFSDPTENQEL